MPKHPEAYIIMGSNSDASVMRPAGDLLEEHGVAFASEPISAHRTPDDIRRVARAANRKRVPVITGAGGSAHLGGMTASHAIVPVFTVAVDTKAYGGFDSELSSLQMPKGVPVGTLNVNGAREAADAVLRVLSLHNPAVRAQLESKLNEVRGEVSGTLPGIFACQAGASVEILVEEPNRDLADESCDVLEKAAVSCTAYRLPTGYNDMEMFDRYFIDAERRGVGVLIAETRLAALVAARTRLPLLGVTPSSVIDLDSSVKDVQKNIASPVPRFAVGVAGAHNAALFALSILGLRDSRLAQYMRDHKAAMIRAVAEMRDDLHKKKLMGAAQRIPL